MRFDYRPRYPSLRTPLFARNVVATSHPLAAQAGLGMLARGGNAVDAAIAAAAVMTIVEPTGNGLGSDAFCILWDGQRLRGLNASGVAPQAWTPAYFRSRHGSAAQSPPRYGWDSVTVPGAVAGWVALSQACGRLPFADLLQPAIEVAERGYAVPVVVQLKWAAAARLPDLVAQPGFAEAFLPHGRAPQVGERFRMEGAARALRAIAATRGEAFYRGEIAQAMVRHAKAHGGALREQDLADWQPQWQPTIAQRYRGHELHQMPPNGQGIAALMALGMLEHFELGALDADGAAAQHLQIEAIKLAFADLHAHVADPRAMRVTSAELLAPDYLAERAKLIDPKRAQRFGPGAPRGGGTIYLAAADASGMMVSFIQSNFHGFGSGVVLPEWGLSLHSRGHGFSLDKASPNLVAPGKLPFHTIIPGFLMKDGAPLMSFGVMGASMQPQGQVQTLVRMLDHRQDPQGACDAPRWRFEQGDVDVVNLEASMPAAMRQGLLDLGHRIGPLADSWHDFGAGQFIWRLGDAAQDGYVAASDPRRDGAAVGF